MLLHQRHQQRDCGHTLTNCSTPKPSHIMPQTRSFQQNTNVTATHKATQLEQNNKLHIPSKSAGNTAKINGVQVTLKTLITSKIHILQICL